MYKDRDKQREYGRRWIAKRRAEWFSDKKCAVCDSTIDLELDHIDPKTKVSNSIWSWSAVRRNAELAKCQVLCKIHHLQKTIDNHDISSACEHGGRRMYSKGCRCDLCRDAKRKDNQQQYRRRCSHLG